jgi:hypothetical protein
MTILEVRCPSCSKRGKIEVAGDKVKEATRGLYAVNISEGIVCEHSFVAYVDKNFTVRDTFIADFQIDLPTTSSRTEADIQVSVLPESLNVDLIKMNITASLLAFILRAMIYKKKFILISDQDFLVEHIKIFFDYITHNSFQMEIAVINEEAYWSSDHGDHVAFNGSEIVRDVDNIIDIKKLKVERTIIQSFLNEVDPSSSMIILKNQINRVFEFAKTIVDMVNGLKKGQKLYSKKVIDELNKVHGIKIQITYLEYLFEVVEHYFEVPIPRSSNISNFLDTL